MYHLIVTSAFGSYAKGDRITDETAIAKALKENPNDVVRVPVPEPEPKKSK